MIPLKIINGDVTSFALTCSYLLPLSVAVFTNILTIAILLIGWRFIGHFFFFSSLAGSATYLVLFNHFYCLPIQVYDVFLLKLDLAIILISLGYNCKFSLAAVTESNLIHHIFCCA